MRDQVSWEEGSKKGSVTSESIILRAQGGKRMDSYRAAAASTSLVLGLLLLLRSPLMVVGQAEDIAEIVGDDCLYETREVCTRADVMGCVWCDLPRRCYSAARSLELGQFCNQKKLKSSVESSTCDEIVVQQQCHLAQSCLWCRSEALDDGCFSEIEAARLPRHIFSCLPGSADSGITAATGLGM